MSNWNIQSANLTDTQRKLEYRKFSASLLSETINFLFSSPSLSILFSLGIVISACGSPTWIDIPCLQKMNEKEIIIIITTVVLLLKKSSQVCNKSPPLVLESQFHRVNCRTSCQSMGGVGEGICVSLLVFTLVKLKQRRRNYCRAVFR